jgi:hypothetical protein
MDMVPEAGHGTSCGMAALSPRVVDTVRDGGSARCARTCRGGRPGPSAGGYRSLKRACWGSAARARAIFMEAARRSAFSNERCTDRLLHALAPTGH